MDWKSTVTALGSTVQEEVGSGQLPGCIQHPPMSPVLAHQCALGRRQQKTTSDALECLLSLEASISGFLSLVKRKFVI